jgi:hypothetical protein
MYQIRIHVEVEIGDLQQTQAGKRRRQGAQPRPVMHYTHCKRVAPTSSREP